MKIFKSLLLVAFIALLFSSCNQKAKETVVEELETDELEEVKEPSPYLGNYVTDGYFTKEEGHDWVAVAVKEIGDELLILVNSRDDIKKPTCTYETLAQQVSDSVYKATEEDKVILFTFDKASVTISSEKPEDKDFLRFYCNGGATLAGTYKKVED